jgi:nucleoside-diphosphate-sugar epimerase
MKKLIVITGYNSFIGQNLRKNNSFKDDVVYIKSPRNIKTSSFELELASIENEVDLSGYSLIVFLHLASYTSYLKRDRQQELLSLRFTRELIAKANLLNLKVPTTIFHTSTIGVLEKRNPLLFWRTGNKRKSEVFASSSYGRMKIEMENVINDFEFSANLRLGWIYGPGMRKNSHIYWIMQSVKMRSFWTKIEWPGILNPIHVEDLCLILSKIIESVSVPSDIIRFKDAVIAGVQQISFTNLFVKIDPQYQGYSIIPRFLRKSKLLLLVPVKLQGLIGNIYGLQSSSQIKVLQDFETRNLTLAINQLEEID